MSNIFAVKVGPLVAASANNITLSQTTAGAANLTLNGSTVTAGVATLDTPRRVIVTSAGNDSGITFTATGTDFSGNPMVATGTGTNSGVLDFGVSFKTITKITTSGATSVSGVTVGTNGVADSDPIFLDQFGFAPTSLQISVSGTANYTVKQTLDNPTDPFWKWATGAVATSYSNVVWINHPDANLVAATTSQQGNYAYVPKIIKVTLNSGTGYVLLQAIQAASPSI